MMQIVLKILKTIIKIFLLLVIAIIFTEIIYYLLLTDELKPIISVNSIVGMNDYCGQILGIKNNTQFSQCGMQYMKFLMIFFIFKSTILLLIAYYIVSRLDKLKVSMKNFLLS